MIDTFLGGSLLVLGAVVLAVVGLIVSRKIFHLDKLKDTHEVGGYLLSVVGTLYAVLLGLIVVDSMAKFQTAREVSESEANSLADVYVFAGCLPKKERLEVREACLEYANQVVDVEWKKMDEGKVDLKAREIIIGINLMLNNFEPQTENQKAMYPILLQSASDTWHARRQRTSYATHGPPMVEWISLLAGSVITVIFTYFFGLDSLKIQMVMTSMVALLISLNLYLFLLFSYPFSGDLRVEPEPFAVDVMIFNHRFTKKDGTPIDVD